MAPDYSSFLCSCKNPEPTGIPPPTAPADLPFCLWCNKPIIRTAPRSFTRLFAFIAILILITFASSVYVHQRDGAGWPVVIWTVQMLLLGFVQLPAIIYLGAWQEKRKQHNLPASFLSEGLPMLLVVTIYIATATELIAIARAIIAPNNQPLWEATYAGFVQGPKIEAYVLLIIAALVAFTLFFWAFFMMFAQIAIGVSSGLEHLASCTFCKKPLPPLPPHYPEELLDPEARLPSHITKDQLRKCPHCQSLVLLSPYSLPRKIANYLGWGVIMLMVTTAVGLRDGWGWPTMVLALEVALVPFGFVPFILKGYLWLYTSPSNGNFNDLPNWKKLALSSLWIGMPLGAPLAVILCMRYNWKIPVHFAGQLGLIAGPLFIACCIFPFLVIQRTLALFTRNNKLAAEIETKT